MEEVDDPEADEGGGSSRWMSRRDPAGAEEAVRFAEPDPQEADVADLSGGRARPEGRRPPPLCGREFRDRQE